MHVLFLSDNFPPESNAPAARTYEHAKRWVAAGCRVTVVTCAPNFPAGKVFPGYRNGLRQREMVDGIEVIRVWSYVTANQGVIKRTLDYLSFMVSATLASLFLPRPDVVVATSPQFFAACAGWMVGAARRRPFVLELRDLWPDSIVAVGAMADSPAIALLRKLEYFLYRRATRIVSVTHSFRRILGDGGIAQEKVAVVRNGADLAAFSPGPKPAALVDRHGLDGAFVAGYIGTVGMAHGLATILDAAALLAGDARIRFLVVGDGAERERLEQAARERRLANVIFVGPVARGEVAGYWRLIDAALVLLRDSPVFATVLPSKMFEAMATARPVILGVRGEAQELVAESGAGLCVAPQDAAGLAGAIQELAADPARSARLGMSGHEFVRSRLDRDRLALQMLEELKLAARA